MKQIFLTKRNADTTEGRGPMVNDHAFFNLDDAEKYIEWKPGTMGHCPKEGRIAYSRKHKTSFRFGKDYGGDWEIETIDVAESLQEVDVITAAQIRATALAKLTDEEKEVLGLS